MCLEATVIVTHAELVLRRATLLELGHLAVGHGEGQTVSKPCPV